MAGGDLPRAAPERSPALGFRRERRHARRIEHAHLPRFGEEFGGREGSRRSAPGREARVEPSMVAGGDVRRGGAEVEVDEPFLRSGACRRVGAILRGDRVLLAPVERREDVEAILREVAPAGGDRALVHVAAAALGDVRERRGLEAAVVLARDEVDDAGDGVGAVDRRRAVLQDLDAIDRGDRDRVDVRRAAQERVVRQAASIEEHEGVAVADAAQVRARHARVAALADRQRSVHAVEVRRHVRQDLGSGGPAAAKDVIAGDRLDRQRGLARRCAGCAIR